MTKMARYRDETASPPRSLREKIGRDFPFVDENLFEKSAVLKILQFGIII